MESEDSERLVKREPEESESVKAVLNVMQLRANDFGVGEESDDDPDKGSSDLNEVKIKIEEESSGDDDDNHCQSDDNSLSPSWNGSSSDWEGRKKAVKVKTKMGTKRKMPLSPTRTRGRPKQPRRINMAKDTSSEEEDCEMDSKPIPGFGYPIEFKMKVLKYAENHSNSATAEKFGLRPKRVRDWKGSRFKIEERLNSGCSNQRPRNDGFTIEEKLKAVALATERSIDEVRLLYNVDRHTIGKWKAKKKELEREMLKGEGNSKRLPGAGMKPRYTQIEKSLREWIVALRLKDVAVNSKMILSKANSLMKEDPSMQGIPGPKTWNWVNGFLKRQKLHDVLGSSCSNREDKAEAEFTKESKTKSEDENYNNNNSSVEEDNENQSDSQVQIKNDVAEDSSSCYSNENSMSPLSKDLSNDGADEKQENVSKVKSKVTKKTTNVREKEPPKPKRPRGRPKKLRQLDDVPNDYTSGEEKIEDEFKSEFQIGKGYPVEFKLKVLKYAETHSISATANKFRLRPSCVGEWKKYKNKIEDKSKGVVKRIKRSFTVEEKLQTIAFAAERSMNEAELLYDVDRNAIRKWKRQKDELEAMLLEGKGDSLKQKGCGDKLKYVEIEEDLRDWIVALRLKGVTLNHKMILNKAKALLEENPNMQGVSAPRSTNWAVTFLRRHNLHGLLGNTLGREDPREVLEVELKTSENVGKNFDKFVEIPENPNKRNRRTISLEDKVNIIRRIEQGETQGNVAKSLKVATSTIQTIWSCRNEIMHKYANPKSKTRSDALLWRTYNAIGAALHDWLEQSAPKAMKVDCSVLMEKAIQLSETYRLPQFSSESKQWLRVFCKKHNLSDVLAELAGNNVCSRSGNSSSLVFKSRSENANSNSANSDDNHDDYDDNHSNSNYDDFPTTTNYSDLQTASLPTQSSSFEMPPQPHNYNSTENSYHKVFSSLCSDKTDKHSAITITEAVKCYSLLRNWIHANYGQHENILNNQLLMVENSILKKSVE